MFSSFSSSAKLGTNNVNNATHYVKLGKKRRKSSKHNYYIISPRVIIKAIIRCGVSRTVAKLDKNLQNTFLSSSSEQNRFPSVHKPLARSAVTT